MKLSVWDNTTGIYRYFDVDDRLPLGEPPKPARTLGAEGLHCVESALITVPATARPAGQGKAALGRLAVLQPVQALAGLGEPPASALDPSKWYNDPVKAPLYILVGSYAGLKTLRFIAKTLWP
jgi:hypothetical protein